MYLKDAECDSSCCLLVWEVPEAYKTVCAKGTLTGKTETRSTLWLMQREQVPTSALWPWIITHFKVIQEKAKNSLAVSEVVRVKLIGGEGCCVLCSPLSTPLWQKRRGSWGLSFSSTLAREFSIKPLRTCGRHALELGGLRVWCLSMEVYVKLGWGLIRKEGLHWGRAGHPLT